MEKNLQEYYIPVNFRPNFILNKEKSLYSDDFIKEIEFSIDNNYNIFIFDFIELDEKLNISFETYKSLMLYFNSDYLSKVNNLVVDIVPEIEHKIEMYSYYLEMKKYEKK